LRMASSGPAATARTRMATTIITMTAMGALSELRQARSSWTGPSAPVSY
jgi:hypothetical protein